MKLEDWKDKLIRITIMTTMIIFTMVGYNKLFNPEEMWNYNNDYWLGVMIGYIVAVVNLKILKE